MIECLRNFLDRSFLKIVGRLSIIHKNNNNVCNCDAIDCSAWTARIPRSISSNEGVKTFQKYILGMTVSPERRLVDYDAKVDSDESVTDQEEEGEVGLYFAIVFLFDYPYYGF